MERTFKIARLALALLLASEGQIALAQPGKSGGKAASHMRETGLENTNAQWSADPERGWERAEERHELHQKGSKQSAKKKSEGSKGKSTSGAWDY